MQIRKCDICEQDISTKNGIMRVVAEDRWERFEFCEKCGIPIHKFLIKKGLVKKEKNPMC